MAKKQVRSMRGEVVDFDVEAIKGQIASRPAPTSVQARQDFIDQKYRRRKKISDQIKNLDASQVDRKLAETPTEEDKKIDEVVAAKEPAPKKKRTIKRTKKTETTDE